MVPVGSDQCPEPPGQMPATVIELPFTTTTICSATGPMFSPPVAWPPSPRKQSSSIGRVPVHVPAKPVFGRAPPPPPSPPPAPLLLPHAQARHAAATTSRILTEIPPP